MISKLILVLKLKQVTLDLLVTAPHTFTTLIWQILLSKATYSPHGRQLEVQCLAQGHISMWAGGTWDWTTNLQVTYRALYLSCSCPTWILAVNLMYFLCFPVDGVLCQNIHVSVFIQCPRNWASALLVCIFDVTLGWNLVFFFLLSPDPDRVSVKRYCGSWLFKLLFKGLCCSKYSSYWLTT